MTKNSRGTFYVRLHVPEGTAPETREALARLLVSVASRFSFQGLEDYAVDLAAGERVLGAEREFHDLRGKGKMSSELRAYFGSRSDAVQFRALVRSVIEDLRVDAPRALVRKDWMKEWRRHYKTQILRAGGRVLRVVPAWKKAPASGLSVRIYPGQAFGTGTHATTRLCLMAAMEGWSPSVRRVLDFGAGTGVLALGAMALAASANANAAAAAGPKKRISVDAVESDPEALAQCRKNFGINRRRARFLLKMPKARYDLVLANVLAPILLSHQRALGAAVASGGRLVLSGILAKEAAAFRRAFKVRALGLHYEGTRIEGDWAAVEYTKK